MTYTDHYGRLWHETDHGTLTAPDAPALGEVTLADLERYMGPLTPEAETWEQDEALDLGGL